MLGIEKFTGPEFGQLFPDASFSPQTVWNQILAGDIKEAVWELFQGKGRELLEQLAGMKSLFVWLILIGILSALLTYFVEIFDHHQIADLSFYIVYLLLMTLLLGCFLEISDITYETLDNILTFVKLMFPIYLATVGVSGSSVTAAFSYQVMLLLIYAVEHILRAVVLPLIYSFMLLGSMNGIWVEGKLTLLVDFLEKTIRIILKAFLGGIMGISIFQSALTPVLDLAKGEIWKKAVTAIPGIGNTAEGVLNLMIGSATVIKGSVGVFLLLLLLFLCLVPLCRIFITAFILKAAAAIMGIVSDKRITACTNRTADAGMLLCKTAGTAMVLFFLAIALVATSSGRLL